MKCLLLFLLFLLLSLCAYDIRGVNICVVAVDIVTTVVDAVGCVVGCGCRVVVYHGVFDVGVPTVHVYNVFVRVFVFVSCLAIVVGAVDFLVIDIGGVYRGVVVGVVGWVVVVTVVRIFVGCAI